MRKQSETLATIDDILSRVGGGQTKRSEANTEAGGYQGGTTHPVKDVDDSTDDAQTGSRFSEHTQDRKEEPNSGQPVEEASEGPGAGGQDSVQMDIGVSNKATGEDSSNETDSTKPGKDDPGSSHPARTDNDSLDGMKYSDYQKLSKEAQSKAKDLLADIAVSAEGSAKAAGEKKPEGKKAETKKADEKKSESKEDAEKAASAGYDLAGVLAGVGLSEDDQKAATASVVNVIEHAISTGIRRAEKAAEYFVAYANESAKKAKATKKAEDDGSESGSDESSEGGSEDSDAEPESEGGGESAEAGGGTPSDDELISAMLAGGEGMGAEDAAAGMAGGGGGDPAALGGDAGGGDPLAALAGGGGGGMEGGMPGGMPGGMGGGMGGDPMAGGGDPMGGGGDQLGGIDMATLEQVLQELGVTPEMLQAAAAGKVAQQLIQRKKSQKAASATSKKSNSKKTAAEVEHVRSVIKEICGITD